jgi:hypothetical protein
MANSTLGLENQLYDYLLSISLREPDILASLREETAKHPMLQDADSSRTRSVYGAAGAAYGSEKNHRNRGFYWL